MHAFRLMPRRLSVEPRRVREVMQRHERVHVPASDPIQDLAVVPDRRLIEQVALWLDAAPFNRQAVGIDAEALTPVGGAGNRPGGFIVNVNRLMGR